MVKNNKNNNNDNNSNTVIMAQLLWELTQFIWWMQIKCQVAANPQTKPTNRL